MKQSAFLSVFIYSVWWSDDKVQLRTLRELGEKGFPTSLYLLVIFSEIKLQLVSTKNLVVLIFVHYCLPVMF